MEGTEGLRACLPRPPSRGSTVQRREVKSWMRECRDLPSGSVFGRGGVEPFGHGSHAWQTEGSFDDEGVRKGGKEWDARSGNVEAEDRRRCDFRAGYPRRIEAKGDIVALRFGTVAIMLLVAALSPEGCSAQPTAYSSNVSLPSFFYRTAFPAFAVFVPFPLKVWFFPSYPLFVSPSPHNPSSFVLLYC